MKKYIKFALILCVIIFFAACEECETICKYETYYWEVHEVDSGYLCIPKRDNGRPFILKIKCNKDERLRESIKKELNKD